MISEKRKRPLPANDPKRLERESLAAAAVPSSRFQVPG